MFSSPAISLIMIAVMSIHSLLGCGIHAVHGECCENADAACCEKSGPADCLSHGRDHETSACSGHSHNHQTKPLQSTPEKNREDGSQKPPHNCQCDGSSCVFVHDAAKPHLIDGVSLEPFTISLMAATCLGQIAICHFQTFEQDFDTKKSLATCCAMKQVWQL